MSHEFIGDEHGAPISAYLVHSKPGEGPPLHLHPYVELLFVIEGNATVNIGAEERSVTAGAIAVVPANTPHKFVNSGTTPLRQIDVHASSHFIQTDLE